MNIQTLFKSTLLATLIMLSAAFSSLHAQAISAYDVLKAPPLVYLKHSSTHLKVLIDNSNYGSGPDNPEVAWSSNTGIYGLAPADVLTGRLFPFSSWGASYEPTTYPQSKYLFPSPTLSYDNNVKVAIHRSHYTNPTYYNPQWRYYAKGPSIPTALLTCVSGECVSQRATKLDITQSYKYDVSTWNAQVPAGNTRIGVGFDPNVFVPASAWASYNAEWKHFSPGTTLNNTFYLSTYFDYIGPQTLLTQRVPTPTLTIANFQKVEIKPSVNRYPALPKNRSVHRTDCAAATHCTYAEEIQNFANWLKTYRATIYSQIWLLNQGVTIAGPKTIVNPSATQDGNATTLGSTPYQAYFYDTPMGPFSTRFGRYDPLKYINMLPFGSSNTINNNGVYNVTNIRLRWSLNKVNDYFKTDASAFGSSCRKNELLMVSAGNYASEPDAAVGYTTTSPLWLGASAVGNNVSYEQVNTAGVSSQSSTAYQPYTTAFVNNAGSPGGTLADITHAMYWTDLLPSRADARRIGNTVAWADASAGSSNIAGSFAQHLGNPVTSQNIRTSVFSTAVPSHIPVSKLIWSNDFGNPSTNNPATLGWYYGQAGAPSTKPNTPQTQADDLVRAAYNGHGLYYPMQSRDLPNRLEPHRALHHIVLNATANHWTKANDTGENAVLEEYLPTGIPMMGVYQTKGNTLEEGNVVAYNGNDPSITASVMANMGLASSTPAWLGFDAQVGLTYQVANQANSNARTVISPVFSSSTAPITSMVRLRQSNSGATTNYSSITTFMQSLLINDVSGGTYDYKDLLDYVQGSSAKEGSDINDLDDMLNRPFRARRKASGTGVPTSGVLGPVFNSTPVIVRHQDYGYGFVATDLTAASYKTFVNTKKSAAPRLAFGANDGMFHVFNGYAATVSGNTVSNVNNKGMEELAYIPAGVYDKLKYTADPLSAHHVQGDATVANIGFRYTVDGPASTGDVYFNNAWRSIVTGSLGAGGKGLFAIDVTTGTTLSASSVLWDKTHQGSWDAADWDDVGHMQNQPGIFKLTTEAFAVIASNGSNSNNSRNALFFINPQTGAVIKKMAFANAFITGLPVDGGNGLMGLAFVFNSKREVVTIYGGDLFGQLYKFDVSNTNPNNWTSSKLFTTEFTYQQPITHKPVVYPHPLGGNLVLFGTGANFRYHDPVAIREQTLYGVWDSALSTPGQFTWFPPTVTSAFTKTNLTEQTLSTTTGSANNLTFRTLSNNAIDYTTKRGWYIRLPLRATFAKADPNQSIPNLETTEQITGNMKIVGNRLVFSSATAIYSQTPENKCTFDDVVKAAVTSVNPLTGGLLDAVLLDTNGDGVINSSDNAAAMGYVQASSGAVGNVTNASGTAIASSAANANGAGVTPYIIRTGSNYGTAYDGIIRSSVQSNPVRSWRQLIPR